MLGLYICVFVCVPDGWGFSYFQSGASPTGLKYQVIGGIHAVQYLRGKWCSFLTHGILK